MLLRVNGQEHEVEVDGDVPLLWVLRDHLGLTGTKFGCGTGICGACTVHLDGTSTRSCVLAVSEAEGRQIATIEALGNEALHVVKEAWIAEQVPQCGYCQPGFIMAVTALLDEVSHPTNGEIDLHITNLCRCGTYPRIRRAIHRAARGLAARHQRDTPHDGDPEP